MHTVPRPKKKSPNRLIEFPGVIIDLEKILFVTKYNFGDYKVHFSTDTCIKIEKDIVEQFKVAWFAYCGMEI